MFIYSNMLSKLNPPDNPGFIAAQLKKPYSFFAKKVAVKMNETNRHLYCLVMDNMCSSEGDNMLEIGFGNGKYFGDFINMASNIKMYGVELSKSMMQQAAEINAVLIDSRKLNLQLINSSVLPFENDSFNAVIAVNLIYLWKNPQEHLQEIFRVLKPGGRFYIGIRPAEVLCKLPFAHVGFHLLSEAEWIEIIETEKLFFIHSQICKEQNIIINKTSYAMQGQCMVFEKEQL